MRGMSLVLYMLNHEYHIMYTTMIILNVIIEQAFSLYYNLDSEKRFLLKLNVYVFSARLSVESVISSQRFQSALIPYMHVHHLGKEYMQ